MTRLLRPSCAPLALALLLFGCGGVREDRTITFSASGDQVGFQHGRQGVFVADKEGGGLTKIFTPDKDVIAVGTPLWAPNDKRLIFTTARAVTADGQPTAPPPPDPAGRVFAKQAVVHTCWLRDAPKGDAAPEPRELFTAAVDHVGYVAVGLGVRWHPKGDRVLYIKQVGEGHAVFEFDLATRASRRVFPGADTAKGVAFDTTLDGSRLVCLLADTADRKDDGLWIGADGADWWHVPASGRVVAAGNDQTTPGRLKAALPAWSKDGSHFAFTSSLAGNGTDDPGRHFLWLGWPDGRRLEQLREEKVPIHDLAWHPDGQRLGFVAGDEDGALRVTDLKGGLTTVRPNGVRSFAGWDATGGQLAYTAAGGAPLADGGQFSLLLIPDPRARDTLCVASGDGQGAGRPLISGLRATFARWSPRDDKLSLWFTFSPPYCSPFSTGSGRGLQPGDPAALIETKTSKITWMTVGAHEEAQVGHYHLLKGDYAEAWRWYARAEHDRAAEKAEPGERPAFDDFSLFAWYCLDKLGRHDEAAARLAEFRKRAADLLPPGDPKAADPELRDLRPLLPLARDLYAAEAFLSLDAAADGEAFFRRALDDARADEDRLSAAVVLSQLVLLQGRSDEYAVLVTKTVAPLLLKSWQAQGAGREAIRLWAAQRLPVALGSLSLAPLCRSDVVGKVSEGKARELAADWEKLRAKAPDDLSRLAADVILERLYRRLGRDKEAADARQRVKANPAAGGRLLTDAEMTATYDGLRGLLEWMGVGVVPALRTGS